MKSSRKVLFLLLLGLLFTACSDAVGPKYPNPGEEPSDTITDPINQGYRAPSGQSAIPG